MEQINPGLGLKLEAERNRSENQKTKLVDI